MVTIGSLFDGSGGFPLAGVMSGATPLWAAEVEPYPIAVTKSRFPGMKHLGDVSTVHGGKIAPVDIITFGSPCQDMSVAGKRAGMKHDERGDEETTRSGLFYEAIRIIREMREATNERYPAFAVWENVPGAFSSQRGEDFRCVLQELAQIAARECVSIPRPSGGKWLNAGEIVGDGFSIAWRVFDAQHWGVPQRRKRIYLVADFRGGRAGKILFERDGLRRNPAPSREARKEAADDAGGSLAGSDSLECLNPWDCQSKRIYDPNGVYPTLPAMDCGGANNQAVIYAMQGNGIDRADTAGCNGCGWREAVGYTLNTIDRHAIAFSPFACGNQQNISWLELVPTLRANGQMTLPGVCFPAPTEISPKVFHSLTASNARNAESAQQPNCIAYPQAMLYEPKSALDENWSEHDVKNALRAEASKSSHVVCIDCRNHTANEVSATLQAKENGGQSLNFINPVCYDTTQITSPMNYSNPKEGDPCHPLCANAHVPLCVYDSRGNGDGKTAPTLTGDHERRVSDYTALAVGNGQLNQISMAEQSNTLDCMHDKQAVLVKGKPPRKYIVRRLTPLECCRLQGFPDGWGVPEYKQDMDDQEMMFWSGVRTTHARVMGKKCPTFRTKERLIQWYNGLHVDSAEYKMWGNGIALPNAYYVVSGCVEELMRCGGGET